MFNRKNRRDSFFSDIPLIFKIWFAFVFTAAISIFVLVGFTFYTVISDPAVVGRIAGEIVSGFNEKVK